MISNSNAAQETWLEQDWLKRWSIYEPKRVPLKDFQSGREFSYETLYRWSNHLASHMKQLSIQPGSRVAILSQNHWAFIPLYFACQRVGATLVPINFRLTAREIAHILNDSKPDLFIYADEFSETVDELLIHPDLDGLNPNCLKIDEIVDFLDDHHHDAIPLEMVGDENTHALILYTSGTTGAPKGAIITRKMIFWNSINTTFRLDLRQDDVHIAFMPFFHTGGWNVLLTPFLHRGAKTILIDKFDPDLILDLIPKERVTIFFGVPTMLDRISKLAQFAKTSLGSLRFAIVGGEPMPLPLIRLWHSRGVAIRQGYGLTEFGPNVFSLQQEHSETKLGSVGFPNFYIDTKIVKEGGQEAAVDEVGELLLRGPACTPGYINRPDATAEAIQEGWFHTGDLFKKDRDGFYYVVGRKKEMFISGGENVYPVEIEQFLQGHPLIQEVAVIGVPDAQWGEVGHAFIVSVPTHSNPEGKSSFLDAEMIQDYCDGQLARFKIPKHISFIESLPKGESGKILKRELLTHAQKQYETSPSATLSL